MANLIDNKKMLKWIGILIVYILIIVICSSCKHSELHITAGKSEIIEQKQNENEATAEVMLLEKGNKKSVPILMYHHFIEDGDFSVDTIVSEAVFEEQIKALSDAGYTAVNAKQIIDFVQNGSPLPENPIYITMDDGYTSNLEIAAPILEKYNMKATVFSIGIYEGEDISPHTGAPLTPPRFDYKEALPWIEKGIMEVQSHIYDMYHLAKDGFSDRDGVLPYQGEDEAAYRVALTEDILKSKDRLYSDIGENTYALAFPYGFNSSVAVEEFSRNGVYLTLTVNRGGNRVAVGNWDSIQCMNRLNVTEDLSGEELVRYIAIYS